MSFNRFDLNRRRVIVTLSLILTPILLTAAVLIALQSSASASSHREAPLISKDPSADNTDTYVFISPENQNNVVFVAGWIPLEAPEGGPNYYEWDDDYLYDIYVDNDGDAKPDVTYTLSSKVQVGNPLTFLYNTDKINSPSDASWNRKQFITVTETLEDGTTNVLVANQLAAPVNIGEKSTPNYQALEAATIYNIPGGGKVFAGQTDDPFFVDLQVFDLVTLRGQKAPLGYLNNNIPTDSLSGFNVHNFVVEVPISRVKSGNEPVLGVWSATRVPSLVVLAAENAATNAGYVQTSRLGTPLTNEVVIPMALKDAFNSLYPYQDFDIYASATATGQLLRKSVEDPEIATLLCKLHNVPLPNDANKDCHDDGFATSGGSALTGRTDIVGIFLTGMKTGAPFTITTKTGPLPLPAGFTVTMPANVRPAEMLRINTNIKGDLCHPTPQRLGLLAGDACGFPNGRRLTDDIVEIELLAVAGAAYEPLTGKPYAFNPALIGVLTDGVDENDMPFRKTFPYVSLAQSGQAHWHTNPYFKTVLPWMQRAGDVLQRGLTMFHL